METQNISETLKEGRVSYNPAQSQNPDGKTLEDVPVLPSLSESCAASEFVTQVPLGDFYGGESFNVHKKLANGDDGNVELENVDGLEGVESEKRLENVDYYNDLEGFEVENDLGNVDDGIDLEALGLDNEDVSLDNLMVHETQAPQSESNKINDADLLVSNLGAEFNKSQVNRVEKVGAAAAVEMTDNPSNVRKHDMRRKIQVSGDGISLRVDVSGPLNGTYPLPNSTSGCLFPAKIERTVGFNKNKAEGDAGALEMFGYPSNVHKNNAPKKIQVSGDGISLTVDVFGPMNGTNPLHNSSSGSLFSTKAECLMGFNRNEAEGDDVDTPEHNFAVGDLVWVKIKTDLWWPGMICDPSALKEAGKRDERNCFFVKHFGNTNSVWCQPFQLKPFVEYFKQMSCHNKSRSFYGAIEKALGEIGRRVKQKMACSCFTKEKQDVQQDNGSGHSMFSVSQFEPADFLKSIRSRALDLCSPGSIEFTVAESCLLAFYCSIGHKQLPLYKLRPTSNAKENALDSGDGVVKSDSDDDYKIADVEMSGILESPRGFESRERKKSKYLSYPYVNSWSRKKGEDETEDHEEDSLGGVKNSASLSLVSTPIRSCSNKNSNRKSRKSVSFKSGSHNADIIAASSAEMLQQLRLTALDCFVPSRSASSVPILEFYSSFRIFRNHGVEVQMDEYTLGCQGKCESPLGANTSENCLASEGCNLQEKGEQPPSVIPKKRGRKKKHDINATGGVVHNGIGVSSELPDLNGNNAGLSVENMQILGPAPAQGKLEPKRKRKMDESVPENPMPDVSKGHGQFSQLLKSVQDASSFPLGGGPQPNADGSAVSNNSPMRSQLFSVEGEGKKRKRIRKEKASNLENNSSALPDLNGHCTTESNLKGKDSAELNSMTSQGKPKRRRQRTTKSVSGKPNPNGDHNNTLLLNFVSGSSVPSKEYLIATFSRFGSLVESKTQFLNDSTAQIVFVRDCDAIEAIQSLQGRNPFGPTLASYRIVSTCNNMQASHSFLPADPAMPSNGEGPNLVLIKQNLEAMRTMLEKAGDDLSPDMKAKLESEVQGFLKKVSSMVGSSSS